MNNALYNIKNGEYNCFCEEQPHNEQCECCDQQCCPCEPSESTELVQSDWNQTDDTLPDYIKHKPTIPTKTSDLTNDSGFITDISGKQDVIEDLDDIRSGAAAGATAYQKPSTGIPTTDLTSAVQVSLGKADTALQTETDPTVPAWAKSQNKPTYTAQEVGALPDSTTIPSALSDLVDDSTHRVVTDTEKTNWNNKSDFSGSYSDLSDKPTIPDVTTKADKVSGATNGNFAALDSNGNLTDSGHKHSDYLTQHQDLTNYVQKSNTQGLLKNDGTVDTTQYLSQHQDISGKADKSEMSVVPGTGTDADKTTITLKQGTSATVLTTHQDISAKENAMPITTATGATLTAVVGNYYRLDNVGTLAITLPTITGATKLQAITFLLACGSSALVTFAPQGTETILYQEDFALEADTTYEVTALWNGSEWTLSRVIYE